MCAMGAREASTPARAPKFGACAARRGERERERGGGQAECIRPKVEDRHVSPRAARVAEGLGQACNSERVWDRH